MNNRVFCLQSVPEYPCLCLKGKGSLKVCLRSSLPLNPLISICNQYKPRVVYLLPSHHQLLCSSRRETSASETISVSPAQPANQIHTAQCIRALPCSLLSKQSCTHCWVRETVSQQCDWPRIWLVCSPRGLGCKAQCGLQSGPCFSTLSPDFSKPS